VNYMVVHGAISGSFGWTAGSAPISILTSPLTLLLGLIAGCLTGVGVGFFVAAVIREDTPGPDTHVGVPARPGSASE